VNVNKASGKAKSVWEKRMLKLLIAILVFPILVSAFHILLMVPSVFVGILAMHLGGDPKFWGKALSFMALVPACWGAFVVCKLIWPG
jgi:hypothetical protein